MVCISYQVQDDGRAEFLVAMEQLGKARRRDGAWEWNVMENINAPGTFQEFYLVHSWLDHLRQHERISKQDAMIQTALRNLLVENTSPIITHFIKTAS